MNGKIVDITKGAPQVISEMGLISQVDDLAKRGYRTIAVAVDLGDGWKAVGIIPLFDPPRRDSAETIERVNDTPALKKADVGIAVHNATDAAKSSANIVLTKSGISVIVDAIEQEDIPEDAELCDI